MLQQGGMEKDQSCMRREIHAKSTRTKMYAMYVERERRAKKEQNEYLSRKKWRGGGMSGKCDTRHTTVQTQTASTTKRAI